MSKLASRTLISSLLASTVVAPAVAARSTREDEATRPCGHWVAQSEGPGAIAAAELLADGTAVERAANHVRRVLHASEDEAQDAAQEAAVRSLARGIKSCCSKTFTAWLKRTAQYVLFDMRKKQRCTQLPEDADHQSALLGRAPESQPGEILTLRDEVAGLLSHHDLANMTQRKRQQLASALGDHLTAGLPPRTGRMKPTRLLDELRPALAELR